MSEVSKPHSTLAKFLWPCLLLLAGVVVVAVVGRLL